VILRSGTSNAIWAGLVSGSGGGSFAMSAVDNIQFELGTLTVGPPVFTPPCPRP
jgi:hypothetical protein